MSLYPLRRATSPSEIPVLPEVGSRMVLPGASSPEASAASIIALAIRSFVEPVGFWPSSLAHRRTPGLGLMLGSPTSGVSPIASRMSGWRIAGDYGSARRRPYPLDFRIEVATPPFTLTL